MMAGLYTILSAAIGCVYFGKRTWAIGLLLLGLGLSCVMLWYHATSALQINW